MKKLVSIITKNNRNLILVFTISMLVILLIGCKSQESNKPNNNANEFNLDLFCKDWKYEKLISDGESYQDNPCLTAKRLRLNKDNTYEDYYTKELDCEEAEEGVWTYKQSSNTIQIKSKSTNINFTLESLSEDQLHISFDEDDKHIEILFSPVN